MKTEDFKIIIVECKEGGYVAWLDAFKGLVIQTEKFEDIPNEIAKSLKVIVQYGFDEKNYEIWNEEKFYSILNKTTIVE